MKFFYANTSYHGQCAAEVLIGSVLKSVVSNAGVSVPHPPEVRNTFPPDTPNKPLGHDPTQDRPASSPTPL